MPTTLLKDLAISESGFVFDPRSGATFTLNDTGRAALDGLRTGLDRAAIEAALVERFEVTGADLHRDVDEFVRQLKQAGFLAQDFALGERS